jgi:hypothetical protein
MNSVDKVLLTYSWIKFIDTPLSVLHMVMCMEISSTEVFNPKYQVLNKCYFKIKENKIPLKPLISIYKFS